MENESGKVTEPRRSALKGIGGRGATSLPESMELPNETKIMIMKMEMKMMIALMTNFPESTELAMKIERMRGEIRMMELEMMVSRGFGAVNNTILRWMERDHYQKIKRQEQMPKMNMAMTEFDGCNRDYEKRILNLTTLSINRRILDQPWSLTLNDSTLPAGAHHVVTAQDGSVAGHGPFTETMASRETAEMLTAPEQGGDVVTVQLNDDMLPAPLPTPPDIGRVGSQADAVDEGGGHYFSIDMDGFIPQQCDQSSAAAAPTNAFEGSSISNEHSGGSIYRSPTSGFMNVRDIAALADLEQGGDVPAVQLNDDMLPAPLPTAPDTGRVGSQAHAVDEGGGHYFSIDMEGFNPQQCDQSSAAAARTNDGATESPNQRTLQALFGALVILCFQVLHDVCKGDECPELIKVFLYIGLGLVFCLAYIGIASGKMAKPAMRVAASASIAALTIAAVLEVSEKVYIKCIIGTIGGAMGILTVAAIDG